MAQNVRSGDDAGKKALDAATHAARVVQRPPGYTRDELVSDVAAALLDEGIDEIESVEAFAVTIARRRVADFGRRVVRERERDEDAAARKRLGPSDVMPVIDDEPRRGRKPEQRHAILANLRRSVRERCDREFQQFAGRPFDEKLIAISKPSGDPWALEDEARRAFRALRAAMLKASEVSNAIRSGERTGRSGGASVLLSWWVPEFIDPLLTHAALDSERDWPAIVDGLGAFVAQWDRYDFLHLPSRIPGASRFLSDRELAIVSLLCGYWPDGLDARAVRTKPLRAGDVIERQKVAIRTSRGRHGTLRRQADKRRMGVDGSAGTRAK